MLPRSIAGRVIATLVLSLGIFVPGITAAAAATSSPAALAFGISGPLCDDKDTGPLCVTDKNGDTSLGTVISGSASTEHPNQMWTLVDTEACKQGTVDSASGSECPFAAGSTLNAKFKGDVIVRICLTSNMSLCVADDGDSQPTLEPPNATGTVWVIAGDSLVNRFISDLSNETAEYLTSDGSAGDSLYTGPFVEGLSQW
jgi:hypothetical protein